MPPDVATPDVALIARGAHGDAIRSTGLVLATPEERVTLRIPAYARASELTWTPDDVRKRRDALIENLKKDWEL